MIRIDLEDEDETRASGSNYYDPYSAPFFDTQSLRDAHFQTRNLNYYHNEKIGYPDDPFNKIKGGPLRNFADLKPHKMDVTHIMEVAPTILEPGPQAIARAKIPLVGSSSVPVRDLKEKFETARKEDRLTEITQKQVESDAANNQVS
ncbi:hypothetical protein V6N12_009296 [Hibiscus sabdariffa]|uniref:Uncharacterized protein n=1 Tax=Hibiscus sabdariffa TaxID=183260 RepID=A0ABR2AV69_9ROSI